MKNVMYLCGGFTTNWQQSITDKLADKFDIRNPRTKELKNKMIPPEYVAHDLLNIKKSDILLVRIESTNPSGIGLSVEVGYAKALNKTIIALVDKEWEDNNRQRHFNFVVVCCDVVFDNEKALVEYLKTF
jgi:nucleoside 2-deoxyribosyltransferase